MKIWMLRKKCKSRLRLHRVCNVVVASSVHVPNENAAAETSPANANVRIPSIVEKGLKSGNELLPAETMD